MAKEELIFDSSGNSIIITMKELKRQKHRIKKKQKKNKRRGCQQNFRWEKLNGQIVTELTTTASWNVSTLGGNSTTNKLVSLKWKKCTT